MFELVVLLIAGVVVLIIFRLLKHNENIQEDRITGPGSTRQADELQSSGYSFHSRYNTCGGFTRSGFIQTLSISRGAKYLTSRKNWRANIPKSNISGVAGSRGFFLPDAKQMISKLQ